MNKHIKSFFKNFGQILTSMNKFIEDVLDEEGKYVDKEYGCNNPFGKCDNCCKFLK